MAMQKTGSSSSWITSLLVLAALVALASATGDTSTSSSTHASTHASSTRTASPMHHDGGSSSQQLPLAREDSSASSASSASSKSSAASEAASPVPSASAPLNAGGARQVNDALDDSLLRCPAVEFESKLKKMKGDANANKYQLVFAPQDDVEWVIAHMQVNDGTQLNVPLKLRADQSSIGASSSADDKDALMSQDSDAHDAFSRKDRMAPSKKRSTRGQYGVPAILGSTMAADDQAKSPNTGDAQTKSVGGPSLSVSRARSANLDSNQPIRSAHGGGDLSGTSADGSVFINQGRISVGREDSSASSSERTSERSSERSSGRLSAAREDDSSSREWSPRPMHTRDRLTRRVQLRRSGKASGGGDASTSKQQKKSGAMITDDAKAFLKKQVELARAMIKLKEGDEAGSQGRVGVWVHEDGITLNDGDDLRVWFTYRATKEAPHVDCDTHTFMFNTEKKGANQQQQTGQQDRARPGVVKQREAADQSSSSLSSKKPMKKFGAMEARPVQGSPVPWRRRPQQGAAPTAAADDSTPPDQSEVCSAAEGEPELKLTYPELALKGEKNAYTLFLNVSSPSNIRWVNIHYLQEGSRLVKLRMSPVQNMKAKAMKLTQKLKHKDASSSSVDSSDASSKSPQKMETKRFELDLTKPKWMRADEFQSMQPMTAKKKSSSSASGSDDLSGMDLSAEGQMILSGSFNASDIDEVTIDSKTGQPTSITIGELTVNLNVVGMPGSTFVMAKGDDASDLRHWKKLLEKVQTGKKQRGTSQSIGGGDSDELKPIDRNQYDDDANNINTNTKQESEDDLQEDEDFDNLSDEEAHDVADVEDDIKAAHQQQQPRGGQQASKAFTAREDLGELDEQDNEEYYPPMIMRRRRPMYPFPGGMGPMRPRYPSATGSRPSMRRPGFGGGSEELETTAGPQLFSHSQSVLMKEGEKIRVFFTFFAPPTYCRTKSFSLIAPNVTEDEEVDTHQQSEAPITPASSTGGAGGGNATATTTTTTMVDAGNNGTAAAQTATTTNVSADTKKEEKKEDASKAAAPETKKKKSSKPFASLIERPSMGRALAGQFRADERRTRLRDPASDDDLNDETLNRRRRRGGASDRGFSGDDEWYGDREDDDSSIDRSSRETRRERIQRFLRRQRLQQQLSRERGAARALPESDQAAFTEDRDQFASKKGTRKASSAMTSTSAKSQQRGAFQQEGEQEEGLTCQQMSNLQPSLKKLRGVSNSAADANNFAITFNAPQNKQDSIVWVDVHYKLNDEVERHYRMEQRGQGAFEHIQPGWSEGIHVKAGDRLRYSFTYRLVGDKKIQCDTQSFNFIQ